MWCVGGGVDEELVKGIVFYQVLFIKIYLIYLKINFSHYKQGRFNPQMGDRLVKVALYNHLTKNYLHFRAWKITKNGNQFNVNFLKAFVLQPFVQ